MAQHSSHASVSLPILAWNPNELSQHSPGTAQEPAPPGWLQKCPSRPLHVANVRIFDFLGLNLELLVQLRCAAIVSPPVVQAVQDLDCTLSFRGGVSMLLLMTHRGHEDAGLPMQLARAHRRTRPSVCCTL